MARKIIGTQWDRTNRNNINDNFEELYQESGSASNLAKENRQRIIKNEMDISELYGSAGQALEAADEAREQAQNAQNRANEAQAQADYAKAQGDYAKDVADNVLTAPHLFYDEDNGITYNYGFKVKDGHLVFIYQEVD